MLPNWYNEYKKIIDDSIIQYLDLYFSKIKIPEGTIAFNKAIYYSVNGGKRIRSILALEFYLVFSGKNIKDIRFGDDIINYCISLELLHTYSLIHDDLPCMDNDELRRGKLTVWKKYGDDIATLVGDLLNSLSFEILYKIKQSNLIYYFGQAVGSNGMVGGQVLDLYYEKYPEKLTLDNLIEIHNKKTGALIEVSILGGLIISENDKHFIDDEKLNNIKKYLDFGKKIGLAFQVKDDILDVEGTIEQTGKSVGGEKKGFVYFIGLLESKKYLDKLINDSLKIISSLKSDKLIYITKYIGNRTK